MEPASRPAAAVLLWVPGEGERLDPACGEALTKAGKAQGHCVAEIWRRRPHLDRLRAMLADAATRALRILPPETAHALAYLPKLAEEVGPEGIVVVCLSGRGDKDTAEAIRLMEG